MTHGPINWSSTVVFARCLFRINKEPGSTKLKHRRSWGVVALTLTSAPDWAVCSVTPPRLHLERKCLQYPDGWASDSVWKFIEEKKVLPRLKSNPWSSSPYLRYYIDYVSIIVQQDAKLYSLFISVNCSTCFGWYLHPSSGAHNTVQYLALMRSLL